MNDSVLKLQKNDMHENEETGTTFFFQKFFTFFFT